jgi:hypothetical protein
VVFTSSSSSHAALTPLAAAAWDCFSNLPLEFTAVLLVHCCCCTLISVKEEDCVYWENLRGNSYSISSSSLVGPFEITMGRRRRRRKGIPSWDERALMHHGLAKVVVWCVGSIDATRLLVYFAKSRIMTNNL